MSRTHPSSRQSRVERIAALVTLTVLISSAIGGTRALPPRSALPPVPVSRDMVGTAEPPARLAPPPRALPLSAPAPVFGDITDYVWKAFPVPDVVPQDLQAQLASEVEAMMRAGHLAPLALIGGVGFAGGAYPWDLGGAKYGPYTLAYLNPADTITALSEAYPLLTGDQQVNVRAYLRTELDAYPIDAFSISGTYTTARPSEGASYFRGTRRERYTIPTDITFNMWPPLTPPVDNLYGLWAYANATGDWDYVQTRWNTVSALYTAALTHGTPDTYGQIGGLIGFARIARRLQHEGEARGAADLAVRGLRAGADFKAFAATADTRRPNVQALNYSVFSYLTPEVGAYLANTCRDAVAAYVADVTGTAKLPTWYLAWGEQTMGGENAFLPPEVSWQIFLAKAYVLGESGESLRRYLDQPWAVGDPYFVQKLVAATGVGGGMNRTVLSAKAELTSMMGPRGGDAPPTAADITDNRVTFPGGQPVVGERFEITFQVTGGVWMNAAIPYDAHAPPGVPGDRGISVDALFSADNWTTVITQPGFLYQDYTRSERDKNDVLIPIGRPVWKIRFAFPTPGIWHFRIRVRDAGGESMTPAEGDPTVTVSSATSHGFVHVSANDRRYFVYDDGTTFNPAGYNEHFAGTYDADRKLARWQGSGINLLRLWMSNNLTGSAWMPWRSMTLPYDGYLPATGLVTDRPDTGIPFTFKLDSANRCMAYGDGATLAVQPGHTYQLTVRVRAEQIVGDGGFTAQLANGIGPACGTGKVAAPLLSYISGSADWRNVTTTFTLPSDAVPPAYLYLILANASGAAYVSDVQLRDVAANGTDANLITRSPATLLGGFNLATAWQWDYLLDRLQAQGITAKVVLLEKNDWVFNHLGRDGQPAEAAAGNTNFYAANGTAARAYEEYYWRNVLARWGAYRSVHSWELLNEGDPNSPDHADLARAFAAFMHAHDVNLHPVTTSFWAGYPAAFVRATGLDYGDIHLYEDSRSPRPPWSLPPPATLDADPADSRNGHGKSVRLPAGVDGQGEKVSTDLHGQGTWVIRVDIRADNLVGSCPYGASASLAGPQLLWGLDGGRYRGETSGGVGVVPAAPSGQAFVCSSPAGTYDWRTVSGTFTLGDNDIHLLSLAFRTAFATSGTARFDNLTVTAPDGRRLPILGNGTFDDNISPSEDLALSTASVGDLYGSFSLAGADVPIVRGETGLAPGGAAAMEDPRLIQDRNGVWLHTLLWGQLAPGGATNLPWYTTSIDANALWKLFSPYETFLAGIPLAAGGYSDVAAIASDGNVRVVGQRNLDTNRAFLWVRNVAFTWQNAVMGANPPPVVGTVRLHLAPGTYRVLWFDTGTGMVTYRETVQAVDDTLTLTLPAPLATDIAVQVMPA